MKQEKVEKEKQTPGIETPKNTWDGVKESPIQRVPASKTADKESSRNKQESRDCFPGGIGNSEFDKQKLFNFRNSR